MIDKPLSPALATRHVDAVVIGAGLGGLLSAAQLLQRGKGVLVLERLPHCGGRFTAKTFQGVQVSTGALHMVPFGSSGVLAATLRRLGVPHRFSDADVFGSFHVHGKQYQARGLLGVFAFLGWRQSFWFTRLGYLIFFRPLPPQERSLPFNLWLERHINVKRNPQLLAFFERIARFALSLELHQVSTAEVIRTTKNMFLYGAPAIVLGGCGEVTRALERSIRERNGEIQPACEVLQILHEDGQVCGVRLLHKASGEQETVCTNLVVSDIGPRATYGLLHNRKITQAQVLKQQQRARQSQPLDSSGEAAEESDLALQEAIGLKVHVLSDISLIPHRGIMYCLDTKRIAGIVQPTNSDPSLAPAGKHLLISHQVMQSSSLAEEKALALADLRTLFGDAFDTHCRVLTMGTYRGEWPVNRIAQGEDTSPTTAVRGLYLVGDAVKPSGYLMAEGVAQSVNCLLDLLDGLEREQSGGTVREHRSNMVSPSSRLNALRWLWKAPGNAGKV